ncbi:Nucleolar protein 6 [Sarcoptes scabiei]|uniref:Nucleolar protein 6 n=1 Tax=Sarcoptes scabiei TaxID=52283 RepID=A0A834RD34_SARSC|nr:Nucleolar protein 6 [Sarcoptes scabiei]
MDINDEVCKLIQRRSLASKLKTKINEWIELLRSKLEHIDEIAIKTDENLSSFLDHARLPIDDRIFNPSGSFQFKRPSLYTIGSLAIDCLVKKNSFFEIDLALVIPKTCFIKKDHQDFKYHSKKAFYLAYLAQHLSVHKDLIATIQFRYHNKNYLKPIIYIKPYGNLGFACRFNLFLTVEEGKSFVFKNLNPCKSNLSDSTHSTPYYNFDLLFDLNLVNFSKHLSEFFRDLPNVRDALMLIRLWLDVRQLRDQFSHIITAFVFHLVKTRMIDPHRTTIQIFEAILNQIVSSDWKSEVLIFSLTSEEVEEQDDLSKTNDDFIINFIEKNSKMNLGNGLWFGSYERLKIDSEITLKLINNRKLEIFTTQIDSDSYYDFIMKISIDHLNTELICKNHIYVESGFDLIKSTCFEISKLCKQAAGNRLQLIEFEPTKLNDEDSGWSINSKPKLLASDALTFRLLITDQFLSSVTKGPIANLPEAESFRQFWGSKCETRRFQDGDIREAVLWDGENALKKRKIITDLLFHVLNTKLNLKNTSISINFNCLDDLLKLNNLKFNDPQFHYGTGEEIFHKINRSLIALTKHLHNLEISTFTVTNVSSVDSVSRGTEVFPPLPFNSKPKIAKNFCNTFDLNFNDDKIKYIRPIKLILKIEPKQKLSVMIFDDPKQLRNLKYLFAVDLKRSLSNNHNILSRIDCNHIDCYYEGFVFRLHLILSKEFVINRPTVCQTKSLIDEDLNCLDSNALDQIEFDILVLPAITSALTTISSDFIAYQLTCRLFKRWLSRQMIKLFFEEITIDLLVAFFFIESDQTYPSSNSHLSCFIRLLDFIVNFDFVANPIIINFNNKLTSERVSNLRESFANNRSKWPFMTIISSYDRKPSYHTINSPDAKIVLHLKKLAGHSLQQMREALQSFHQPEIKKIFRAHKEIFDVLIRLSSKHLLQSIKA